MKNTSEINQVAAVSGATGAIGKAIARKLAGLNYQVYLIARDEERCHKAAEEIKTSTSNQKVFCLTADLSRQQSIQRIASAWRGPLHLLINNAAITPVSRLETPEGIELQFATNVLGYFWMSVYFQEALRSSAPSRIVNVASYWAGGLDLDDLEFQKRSYTNQAAYRQSKQANRMLTPVFAEEFQMSGITVNACHPGDVNSKLSNNLGFGGSQTPDQGARTPVWLGTSAQVAGITGKYFEDLREVACPYAAQRSESRLLYQICQAYTKEGEETSHIS
jgi:NAD(P)-dependent dehydrogenase (short-subunit alcohol dehydrogenase family)